MSNQSDTHDGNYRLEIAGEHQVRVGRNRTETVDHNETISIGKRLAIEAGDEIVLKVGAASLTMKKDGTVIIRGRDIVLDASGNISVKSDKDVVLEGSKIRQN